MKVINNNIKFKFLDQVYLDDLYNKDEDSAVSADCCKSLKILEYPEVMCGSQTYLKKFQDDNKGNQIKIDEQIATNPTYARHCLNIFVFDKVNWKICHFKKDEIMKLRLNLVYNILQNQLKTVPSSLVRTKIIFLFYRKVFSKHVI